MNIKKRTWSLIFSFILIFTFLFNQSFILKANAETALYGIGKVTTTSTNLNVRKSASKISTVLTTLKRNSPVTLIKKSGEFWYVKYSATGYGYCSDDFITVTSKNIKVVNTTSGNLNVRASANTTSNVVSKLAKGVKVPVISVTNGWAKILYNGTKTGYVNNAYLKAYTAVSPDSGSNYKAISLNVPDFKQTDTRWANHIIGSSGQTMAKIGCATTAIAMLESKRTNTTIYPHIMESKLNYTSGGSVYWPSYYTQTTNSSGYLTKIYNLLKDGKPVIVGAKKSNGSMHFVVVTGVKSTSELSTSSFYINDPGSKTRVTLNQFFNDYPYFYKMLHY